MRELRHDFRAYYHVGYDDVEVAEAVDLIMTLPPGSLYRASLNPHAALGDAVELDMQRNEALRAIGVGLLGSEQFTQMVGSLGYRRPWDEADEEARRRRDEASRRAVHEAVTRMNATEWKAVER
ncbi:MAG: hypothetical protein ACI360_08590 [Atopobiaceae bacterium]